MRSMSARRPPYAPTGRPPPITLPKRGEIGRDAEARLRAAERDAEAGDHLVEDQQRAVAIAQRAQPAQEALGRKHQTHVPGDRLDDDRGDLAAALRRTALRRPRGR